MQQWEYKLILAHPVYSGIIPRLKRWNWQDETGETVLAPKARVTDLLNQLGDQGWELIATLPRAETLGVGEAGHTTSVEFYFKRPKS